MTGEAVRQFSDDVRGGRRDEQEIGAIGEIDMSRAASFLFRRRSSS